VHHVLKKLDSEKEATEIEKETVQTKDLTPQAPVVLPSATIAEIGYDNQITAGDENDCFDEEKLLKLIPQEYRPKAETLLNEFDSRGNELTWNPSGIIFIDQVPIPNSNIYHILPSVYKKRHPTKVIPGLEEFISKVSVMGYGNLINLKVRHSKVKTEPKVSYENWWYLGP
jgi:hypothetical protein